MSSQSSTVKTLIVAAALCIICATLVSSISVSLKERQIINKKLDKKRNILKCAGLIEKNASALDVAEAYQRIEERIVDLATGELKKNFNPYTEQEDENFLATSYDQRKANKTENLNVVVEDDKGSGIKKRAKYALVYLVKEEGKYASIILPILSNGLWGKMHGFLAVSVDTTTIKGFAYYEHVETPGLGGEVNNPKWVAQWKGKKAYNNSWEPAISVIKGKVNPEKDGSQFKVDGLSGATITSNGVSTSLQYWLSDQGYGLFLENIRKKGVQ